MIYTYARNSGKLEEIFINLGKGMSYHVRFEKFIEFLSNVIYFVTKIG